MEAKSNLETVQKVGSGGFLNPEKIVDSLIIKGGYRVADFGCGAGYFTIPIAKKVSNGGKVYAIDVLTDSLEAVKSKAKLFGLLNIETVRANVESVGGTKIKDRSLDLVVLANILFQCNDYNSVFSEAKRILKDSGEVVIIDWVPDSVKMGPKYEHCLSKDDVKKLAIRNGFRFMREIDAGDRHYGMLFSLI
ncbi:MAG: class I SAM-dependent methyltransferase [Candidatus Paceibacterota bacterium]|jgi:ubiquinone/menaquinone biosynthesis C-methylase UbiE